MNCTNSYILVIVKSNTHLQACFRSMILDKFIIWVPVLIQLSFPVSVSFLVKFESESE